MQKKPFNLVTTTVLADLTAQAKTTDRLRINYNFHQLTDTVQRFLNVAARDSYIRPHKHQNPDKTETFILLRGRINFLIFDDQGQITESFILSQDGENLGIDVHPGVWHTFIVLSDTCALFEIKEGPYDPSSDKTFAPFAPQEHTKEATAYLTRLRGGPEV